MKAQARCNHLKKQKLEVLNSLIEAGHKSGVWSTSV